MARRETTKPLFWKSCGAVPVAGNLRRLSCQCDTSLSGTGGRNLCSQSIELGSVADLANEHPAQTIKLSPNVPTLGHSGGRRPAAMFDDLGEVILNGGIVAVSLR